MLALLGSALVGCSDDIVRLPVWQLSVMDGDGDADGNAAPRRTRIELPVRIDDRLPHRPLRYTLHTTATIPAAWQGHAVTLSIPYLPAMVELTADSTAIPPLDDDFTAVYRGRGPHAWRLPAALTRDGTVELALTVHHEWTQSAWLDTVPRLSNTVRGDFHTLLVHVVNDWGNALSLAALLTIAFTYLVLWSFDRKNTGYFWMCLQTASVGVYMLFILGISQRLFGRFDIAMTGIGLATSAVSSVYATHAKFRLGKPSRFWPALWWLNLAIWLVVHDVFTITHFFGPIVAPTVSSCMIYHVWRLSKLIRQREMNARTHLLAWILATVISLPDQLVWHALDVDLLGGLRIAGLGLTLWTLLQFVALCRLHHWTLVRADRLNTELAAQMELLTARQEELTARQVEIEDLNQALRRQIAERSRQLADALMRIGTAAAKPALLGQDTIIERRYRVLAKIGSGAMGDVYKVERLSDARVLAMKVLRDISNMRLMARFAREAQIASEIAHPNVVAILDFELSDAGLIYLVMEYVEGASLKGCNERYGEVPWALHILRGVSAGLAAVHAKGVIHRDLKPENVLLSSLVAATPTVKITDFGVSGMLSLQANVNATRGLADHTEQDSAPTSDTLSQIRSYITGDRTVAERPKPNQSGPVIPHLTQTGMLLGTPKYMAPELARGAGANSPAADIFGLGVMAYELLTGRFPFALPPCWALLHGHAATAAEPLVGSSPEIPAEIAILVDRALAFEPEQRPTASELHDALTTAAASMVAIEPAG